MCRGRGYNLLPGVGLAGKESFGGHTDKHRFGAEECCGDEQFLVAAMEAIKSSTHCHPLEGRHRGGCIIKENHLDAKQHLPSQSQLNVSLQHACVRLGEGLIVRTGCAAEGFR